MTGFVRRVQGIGSRWRCGIWGVALALGCTLGTPPGVGVAADMLKIGLLEEPKTLNVLRASDRWSVKVLDQIYQSLLIRDPETLELVPWLAAEMPVFDPAGLTYTVKLREAKWSDGSDFTAEDVVFTANLIKEFEIPRYISQWTFVSKAEALDAHTVRFHLEEPKAIFLPRTLDTPIVSRREWEAVAEQARTTEKPLDTLMNHVVEKPLGCGPFLLNQWKEGAFIHLKRNEHFFGKGKEIRGRPLGPHIDGMLFKFFGTADAAILGLKKGTIDMFWWGIQPGYLEDLEKDGNIQLFRNERSALYYLGFNTRKPPFDDPALRRAVATLIDRSFIIQRILQGQGEPMHTIVPAGNRFWCCPDPYTYGEGLSREQRLKQAFEILQAAGYSWVKPPVDANGKVGKGEGIRLPGGAAMAEWTILTPPTDYDPLRAMSGTIIQEWLKEAGIPASAKPMAFSALLQQVKTKRDFDAFILAYGSLSLDPDYLRNFFHSQNDQPRGWNMGGYHNPEYDRLADESVNTVDDRERQKLVWEMQRIISRDAPYIPLYNPKLIEAVRKDRFAGWVNALEGIGNVWSFCQLKPL